jgi:hypothetical protein
MTAVSQSSPASPIDIAKTIERARAAWSAGRADEAEQHEPTHGQPRG